MRPLVSIIIPIYNCQRYITRCLSSLLEQIYDSIEILVVDDGSTDESAVLIKQLQTKHSQIKYFYQKNSGPGVARNTAIKESKGKYLLFVDADDYLSNNYVLDLVESAESNQSELTIAGYTLVYENGKKSQEIIPNQYVRNISEEWAYRISACCSRLYSREFWINQNLHFCSEKNARAEDVPIVLFSNVMAKNISIVQNSGYYYYQHSESAMNNKKERVIFGFPYQAFGEMYKTIKNGRLENSKEFFYFGILKFLAQFEFLIYRKADKPEKKKYQEYLCNLLRQDFRQMSESWEKIRKQIELPLAHKVAINLFILKYRRNMTNR